MGGRPEGDSSISITPPPGRLAAQTPTCPARIPRVPWRGTCTRRRGQWTSDGYHHPAADHVRLHLGHGQKPVLSQAVSETSVTYARSPRVESDLVDAALALGPSAERAPSMTTTGTIQHKTTTCVRHRTRGLWRSFGPPLCTYLPSRTAVDKPKRAECEPFSVRTKQRSGRSTGIDVVRRSGERWSRPKRDGHCPLTSYQQ